VHRARRIQPALQRDAPHHCAGLCDMPLATFKKLLVELAALVVKEAA
jgi:hypothetical protein